jgi:hypothetical protein
MTLIDQIYDQAVTMLEIMPELEITSAVREAANEYGFEYGSPEMGETVNRVIKMITEE